MVNQGELSLISPTYDPAIVFSGGKFEWGQIICNSLPVEEVFVSVHLLKSDALSRKANI